MLCHDENNDQINPSNPVTLTFPDYEFIYRFIQLYYHQAFADFHVLYIQLKEGSPLPERLRVSTPNWKVMIYVLMPNHRGL
jgi:hypothetical protein